MRKIIILMFADIIGGIMFDIKQTTIVAIMRKKIVSLILLVVAGTAISIIIILSYLCLAHTFLKFVYQVFQDTSSKETL